MSGLRSGHRPPLRRVPFVIPVGAAPCGGPRARPHKLRITRHGINAMARSLRCSSLPPLAFGHLPLTGGAASPHKTRSAGLLWGPRMTAMPPSPRGRLGGRIISAPTRPRKVHSTRDAQAWASLAAFPCSSSPQHDHYVGSCWGPRLVLFMYHVGPDASSGRGGHRGRSPLYQKRVGGRY